MSVKAAFRVACMAILIVLMTGCTTYLLVDGVGRRETADTFVPRAVYQATNDGDIALEGWLCRYDAKPIGTNGDAGPVSYLILPASAFRARPVPKSGELVVAKIGEIPFDYLKNSKIKTKLPSGYLRTCVLLATEYSFVVRKHHPDRIKLLYLPFTIVVDVAFLPISAWGYAILTSDWC